jgi:hypothetical protein
MGSAADVSAQSKKDHGFAQWNSRDRDATREKAQRAFRLSIKSRCVDAAFRSAPPPFRDRHHAAEFLL